ncbi:MAG: TetR/AcrR family transcriptional regulator [Chloroflexi bacterium]|nr:MAG: TetR/AcrR family transcriptional regulator [Chloroflexota bacterium]
MAACGSPVQRASRRALFRRCGGRATNPHSGRVVWRRNCPHGGWRARFLPHASRLARPRDGAVAEVLARTGRRPGTGDTAANILAAARVRFARVGYAAGTIRSIAAEAGVDPALVLHYFGSKAGLFRAAVDFPVDPAVFVPQLLAPGLDGLGGRLVHFFLETWDSPSGRPLLALIRSVVASDEAAALLREFVSREVLGRLARALRVDRPQLRASLAASTLIGMAMLRYVIKVEPLATARSDAVAGWLGPAVQRYLTDPEVTSRSR